MKEISRKDFLREVFGFFRDEVRKGASGVAVGLHPYLPPPGSRDVHSYVQYCTQCFNCVSACPPMALQVCRDRASVFYGYPVIDPRRKVCEACVDYPCISACPTEALEFENKNRLYVKAVIVNSRCLVSQNHFCISCVTACPPHLKAIALNADGFPEVDPRACTGCGLCAQVCPAPQNAIEFSME